MSRNVIAACVALALSLLWAGFLVFVHFLDDPTVPALISADMLTTIVTAAAPVVLIWLTAATIASSASADDELWKLSSEIRNLRAALANRDGFRGRAGPTSDIVDDAGAPYPVADDAGSGDSNIAEPLPATGARTGGGIPNSLMIRALNFAEDTGDVEGIAAVDAAARIPEVSDLLDASMRILHSFADAGIALENLDTKLAAPEDWRNADLGGSVNIVAGMGRIAGNRCHPALRRLAAQDPEFHPVAEDFRRRALNFVEGFVAQADDNEITAMLTSRTILAFLFLENAEAAR